MPRSFLRARVIFFFFSSRRRHTRFSRDWSSDVCSSDLVAVEGEGQRAADAFVVEGLALVIDRHERDAVPGALLHRDLRAERLDQAVAVRGGEAAELDVSALAPDGRDLGRG